MYNFNYQTEIVNKFFNKTLKRGSNPLKINIQKNSIKQFKDLAKITNFSNIFLELLYKNRLFVELFRYRKAKKFHLVPQAIRKKRTVKNFYKNLYTLQKNFVIKQNYGQSFSVILLYQRLFNNIIYVTKKQKNILKNYMLGKMQDIRDNRFYFHFR